MPRSAPHSCAVPGCPRLTDQARCSEHRGVGQKKRIHHPWQSVYGTAAWHALSRRTLREEPTCRGYRRQCLRPSSHADHIVAVQDGGARFSRANTQGLCDSCHGRKTQAEIGARAAGVG